MLFAPVPHRLGLYPVVESLAWLVRILEAGVTTVQLRIKDINKKQIDADIEAAILLGKRYHARVFINDYWKLAIKFGAYGIHLGQQDMNTADASAISAAGLRVGISTHNDIELARALTWQPSYISVGHIFPTNTKIMESSPQGLKALHNVVSKLPNIPTVAIGGINVEQVESVLACGVGGVAMVSAITKSSNWRQTISILQSIINKWQ